MLLLAGASLVMATTVDGPGDDSLGLLGGPPAEGPQLDPPLGSAASALPGDFDGSGKVDRDDLAIFLGLFGSANPGATDLDGDGDNDRDDLGIFLGYYGNELPPAPEPSGHAPEPLTVLGLVLGLGSVGLYVRRKRMK
jgi:hypothetical protein